MPVQVTRLPGEPIIHAVLTGFVGEAEVLEMFRLSAKLAQDMPGTVYRVTETRNPQTSFSDMVLILRDLSENHPGSTSDPRFVGVLAGVDEATRFVAESSQQQQYGQVSVPLFGSADEALAYLRKKIANGG
jgi:hypothetical protein